MTGSDVAVWIIFFNNTPGTLNDADGGSVLSKMPNTNYKDLFSSFAGVVDTQGYTVNTQDGSVIAVLECASPMASLGLVKSIRTSMDSILQYETTLGNNVVHDSAFDQVYQGSKAVQLLWGKK
jgi:hypothetical protein